ncbi:MAG TPA: twin-arginine translocase TatA/TatE family subunit [Rubricoccaceae bacterium]|nr:twin-arginine translocase TatA/TatE family subunit [Rubricoccaceae bacterium]
MGNIGAWELVLIFLVILLVFGAKRIPEIARGMGRGIREFKDATQDIKREITLADQPPPPQVGPPSQARAPQYPAQQAYAPPPAQAQPEPHTPATPPVGAPPPAPPPTEGQPSQS